MTTKIPTDPAQSDRESDLHTMPNDGKHDASVDCFCWPELYHVDPDTGVRCYAHRETRKENLS